ncbi:unnamed protein product, partial [marine sediment metagenome]
SLLKKSNKDTLFLSSWFFLIFVFNIFTNFIAARFSLLLLPPLFLFIYNKLSSYNFAIVKPKLKFIIFISIIFSTVLAIGDYRFAGVYRNFVISFKKKLPLDKVIYLYPNYYSSYFAWGFAYYLEKFYPPLVNIHHINMPYEIKERLNQQDGIFITATEPVLPVVIEKRPGFDMYPDSDFDKDLINSIYYRGNVFLHNRKFHAGFYCHDWGLLPFYLSLRKMPLEKFEVYKLSYSPKDGS